MNSKNIILVITFLAIAISGWFYVKSLQVQSTSSSSDGPAATPNVVVTPVASPSAGVDSELNEKNLVKLNSQGFSPQTLTIKVGESVTWVNQDSTDRQANSDPHPAHTIYAPLNTIGFLKVGEKRLLSFPAKGVYKFHDHLYPQFTGSIVVE